jgi:hypothetical protein
MASAPYSSPWPPERASQMAKQPAERCQTTDGPHAAFRPAARSLSFGGQRLPLDVLLAARDFQNLDPSHAAHILTFDRSMPVVLGQGHERIVIYSSDWVETGFGCPAFQRLNVAPGTGLKMLSLLRVAADFGRCRVLWNYE